jgi:hypothetical protein
MKNFPRRLLAAIVFVLFILSVPLWLPSLQALAAPNQGEISNPVQDSSAFYIFDAGWTSGSLTQKVMAVPQVLSWSADQETGWATETGFIYGGFRDAETGRIYITEQRNANYDSLLNVTFAGDVLYAASSDWFMHLATLDGETGEVIGRVQLDLPALAAGGSALQPLGISGDTLYLMSYAYRENLFAFDLTSNEFTGDRYSLCEKGYLVEAEFFPATIDIKAKNHDSSRIAALCVGHENGTGSSITVTDLANGEQRSLALPQFGTDEYQTGNGIFSANRELFAIDSEAGLIVSIDMTSMQIAQTSNYREGLAQQTSWLDGILNWVAELVVRSAAAKRLSALTAVSPDGRWLVVDNSEIGSHESGREILVIALQDLEVKQTFELPKPPVQLVFGADSRVLAIFDKPSMTVATPGVVLDLTSGEQQQVSLPTHGWILNVLPAQ